MAKKTPDVPNVEPDPLTLLALSKSVKETTVTQARSKVKPGTNEIHRVVMLRGVLTIAPDVPGGAGQDAPGAFSPWLLLAILLQDSDPKALEKLATKAAEKMKSGGMPAVETWLKALYADYAMQMLPKIFVPGPAGRRGSVSFAGRVELATT